MVFEGPGIYPKSLLRDFSPSLTPSVLLCLFVHLAQCRQFCDIPRSDIHSCFSRFPQHSDLMMIQGPFGKSEVLGARPWPVSSPCILAYSCLENE